jgi:hypothetical protein
MHSPKQSWRLAFYPERKYLWWTGIWPNLTKFRLMTYWLLIYMLHISGKNHNQSWLEVGRFRSVPEPILLSEPTWAGSNRFERLRSKVVVWSVRSRTVQNRVSSYCRFSEPKLPNRTEPTRAAQPRNLPIPSHVRLRSNLYNMDRLVQDFMTNELTVSDWNQNKLADVRKLIFFSNTKMSID